MKRTPTEQQRLKKEYDAYIAELRRLKAEKYGEQLTLDFGDDDASTNN